MKIQISAFICTLMIVAVTAGEPAPNANFPTRGEIPTNAVLPVRGKAATTVKVVPHLSANSVWKSSLSIRNDADYAITLTLEFIGPNGSAVTVKFFDSDGQSYNSQGINVVLQGFEIYSLDFDNLVSGQTSFQVFAASSDEERFYQFESTYNRYDGSNRLASVGVTVQKPMPLFLMNLDRRAEFLSGNLTYRGLAITNTTNGNCTCNIQLYDDGKNGENLEGYLTQTTLTLPPFAKWVGLEQDLFPDIDDYLRNGFGYLLVDCGDRPVSALGLAFEDNSPIAASVPIASTDVTAYEKRKAESREK